VPGLKAALDLMGMAGGTPRPPLRSVAAPAIDTMRKQLNELGVLADLKVGAASGAVAATAGEAVDATR
jgi:hypothetical protein